MIIGQFESKVACKKLGLKRKSLENYENLSAAKFFLALKVSAPHLRSGDPLSAVLLLEKEGSVQGSDAWPEEGRIIVQHDKVSQFATVFNASTPRSIRIQFILPDRNHNPEDETSLYIETKLRDLCNADNGLLEVRPVSMDKKRPVPPDFVAQLAVKWLQFADATVLIDCVINITKTIGWPFSSARPFFVLYSWKGVDRTWECLYRSEKSSEGIASKKSRNFRHKGSVELPLKCMLVNDRSIPLRLEIMHHHPGLYPRPLGLYITSFDKLRQEPADEPLDMEIGAFPQGELVGELRMKRVDMKSGRFMFKLEANFGGHPKGPCAYFGMTLTETRRFYEGARRVDGPVFFVIQSLRGSKGWLPVYESERLRSIFERNKKDMCTFKIAKLSLSRLHENNRRQRIRFKWFHGLQGRQVELGSAETSLEEMIRMPTKTELRLSGDRVHCNGLMVVGDVEKNGQHVLVHLHCILNEQIPRRFPM